MWKEKGLDQKDKGEEGKHHVFFKEKQNTK